MSMSTSKAMPDAGASAASSAKPPNKPTRASSFPWLSLLVGILAVAVAALALLQPAAMHAARTRTLQFVDRLLPLGETSASVDCSRAQQYLTDVLPVKGFHVMCLEKQPGDRLVITAYKDGNAPALTVESDLDLSALDEALEQLLAISPPEDEVSAKYKQPRAFFSPDGRRLELLSEMANSVLFLFEGGQFIWPGVKVGHKTLIKDVSGKGDVVMETLSMTPLVFSVEEFLKDDEIDVIMELSLPHLAPSGVTLLDGHENRPATDWRTSTTYFLDSSAHPILTGIDRRVADLTKVPVSHQEAVQVLRYEATQKYDHHTDYFPAEHHQNSPGVLEMIDYGHKNRMITVFWYMSDVAEGGHTIFPRAGGLPPPRSMKDCSKGLKVPPRKRKVIVFYSMLPTGEGDPMSLHGGCPVIDGVKYSGNKWIWNKPM